MILYGPFFTGTIPGTTITRMFHCGPRVAMHHHRSAWLSTTTASIDQASADGTSGSRTYASTSAPPSSPVCSSTIGG